MSVALHNQGPANLLTVAKVPKPQGGLQTVAHVYSTLGLKMMSQLNCYPQVYKFLPKNSPVLRVDGVVVRTDMDIATSPLLDAAFQRASVDGRSTIACVGEQPKNFEPLFWRIAGTLMQGNATLQINVSYSDSVADGTHDWENSLSHLCVTELATNDRFNALEFLGNCLTDFGKQKDYQFARVQMVTEGVELIVVVTNCVPKWSLKWGATWSAYETHLGTQLASLALHEHTLLVVDVPVECKRRSDEIGLRVNEVVKAKFAELAAR